MAVLQTLSRVAVVDIGSNSVRTVVYDGLKRTPLVLFNEKVLCGMARDMEKTGVLHPQGVAKAVRILDRFSRIIARMRVGKTLAVATSAVRDAKDGEAFIATCRQRFSLDIRVLTGAEEAYFTSLGVMGAFYEVNGVVGDLGGGSLEVAEVKGGDVGGLAMPRIGPRDSFPIGPLRLRNMACGQRNQARAIVDRHLETFGLGKMLKDKQFYAVGGGFRALAKIHLGRADYPLGILHQYDVSSQAFLETTKLISSLSPARLRSMPSVPIERADTLAFTAIVMERIIIVGKPSRILFSVHGVREGILYDQLSATEKAKDGLIAGVEDVIGHLSPIGNGEWVAFGHALAAWMQPLFPNEGLAAMRLRLAACILSRLAWHEHTNYRAEMAFRWVLDSTLPAITHAERAFIALAVYHRYKSEVEKEIIGAVARLLPKESIYRASIIGHAMRLGYGIAAGVPSILERVPIRIRNGTIVLLPEAEQKALLAGSVPKRLIKLADILGYEYKAHDLL